MRTRPLQPGDVESMQARSSKPYDKLPMPAQIEDAFALVDDSGTVRAVFMAERVAEVFLLLDHEWETPAMRWEAIRVGVQEVRRRLTGRGFRAAYAYFGEGVPDGYVRRLVKACGAEIQKRIVRFAHE